MNNKKLLLGVFFAFAILAILSFMVSAATTINPTLPAANFTNISGSAYQLNATILGGGAAANTTYYVIFYYQAWGSSSWTQIANTSNVTGSQWYFNATWDTTAVDDGKNYTINATAYNGGGTVNATNITGNNTLDNTPPVATLYSGSSAYTNGTIKTATTQNLTLNISLTDATIGMTNNSAAYCFINLNGEYNHTVPLSNNQWCNYSLLNLTGLSDGNITINIYANDTLNELLNSSYVVQLDTTNPTATATCSPPSVTTGAAFPCTCSTSDATSGINSALSGGSSTSHDVSSTSQTGVFTYTCSATDYAGLTASATAQYVVTQIAGTSSGGGGSSSTTNPAVTNYITQINKGTATVVKNFDSSIGVKQIEINVNNQAQNVQVKVTKYDSKPAAVSVEKSGTVYQYVHFDTQNLLPNLKNAVITFRVNKSWVSDNNLNRDEIVVSKYNETENKWGDLNTVYDSEDDNYYYYNVTVTSFSYFAISEKSLTETGIPGSSTSSTGGTTPSSGGNIGIIIIIIIILAAAAGGVAYNRKQVNS